MEEEEPAPAAAAAAEEEVEEVDDDDDYVLPEEPIDLAAAAVAAVEEVVVEEEAVAEDPVIEEEEEEEEEEDEGFFGKFKSVEGQFEVLEVSIDCSRGVNMTGLMLGQNRGDGLLHVRVCRPGGTASKKVKVNDVILATTYVVLTPDPVTNKPVATLEWLDATDGASNEDIQGAMMTHSQEMKLVLARGSVEDGHFDQPSPAARERCSDASIGGGVAQPEECVPEDVKAWAARVAAEARAVQTQAAREKRGGCQGEGGRRPGGEARQRDVAGGDQGLGRAHRRGGARGEVIDRRVRSQSHGIYVLNKHARIFTEPSGCHLGFFFFFALGDCERRC